MRQTSRTEPGPDASTPSARTLVQEEIPLHQILGTEELHTNWTKPRGPVTSQNNIELAVDGEGHESHFGYDTVGNLTSITDAKTQVTSFTVNSRGLVETVTEGSRLTDLDYDTTTGELESITDPKGHIQTFNYDPEGRVETRVDPRGHLSGADPLDYDTHYTYNAANQLHIVEDPLGHSVTLDYDDRGQLETVTDAKDQVTSYLYTGQGQLARTTADDASHTDLQYDATGNLTERIDANAHTTTFDYNDAGQRISTSTQEGSLWTYGYDPAGNLEHVTDANGNATSGTGDGTTAYGYDELNRLKTIDYSDATPDVGLGYDRDNNRTSMTDAAGTQTYGYDELDRLTQVTRGTATFAYEYDRFDNVTKRTYPAQAAIDYRYDAADNLHEAERASKITTYDYTAADQLETTTYPSSNGHIETRTWDRAGRLEQIRSVKGNDVLADYQYSLDENGNPFHVEGPTARSTTPTTTATASPKPATPRHASRRATLHPLRL